MKTEKRAISKSEEVYELLKQQIITLQIPPGQQVMEVQVSKQFNVSRTPVRAALLKLVHEGYLSQEDGRIYVNNLTIKDMKEIFHLREALEAKAACLAAERNDNALVQKLKNINQKIMEALDNQNYAESCRLDNAFHDSFIEASGNKHIIEVLSKYNLLVSRVRYLTIMSSNELSRTTIEHQQIIDAFEKGEPDLVLQITSKHVKAARHTIEKYEQLTGFMNVGLH